MLCSMASHFQITRSSVVRLRSHRILKIAVSIQEKFSFCCVHKCEMMPVLVDQACWPFVLVCSVVESCSEVGISWTKFCVGQHVERASNCRTGPFVIVDEHVDPEWYCDSVRTKSHISQAVIPMDTQRQFVVIIGICVWNFKSLAILSWGQVGTC